MSKASTVARLSKDELKVINTLAKRYAKRYNFPVESLSKMLTTANVSFYQDAPYTCVTIKKTVRKTSMLTLGVAKYRFADAKLNLNWSEQLGRKIALADGMKKLIRMMAKAGVFSSQKVSVVAEVTEAAEVPATA
jgi:hypothetical protein